VIGVEVQGVACRQGAHSEGEGQMDWSEEGHWPRHLVEWRQGRRNKGDEFTREKR